MEATKVDYEVILSLVEDLSRKGKYHEYKCSMDVIRDFCTLKINKKNITLEFICKLSYLKLDVVLYHLLLLAFDAWFLHDKPAIEIICRFYRVHRSKYTTNPN